MSNPLSDADAQKLFNEVSQSIRSNDVIKLDELVEAKPAEGNPENEETPAAPVVDEPQETTETQEPSTPADGTQEETPPTEEVAEEVPAKQGEQTPDELATLKEQLENIKKENHRLKSQAGRMPHMQSKVKELDKKLEELRKYLSSPSSQPSAKIKPELQKKLQKLKETDPELAEVMEETLSMTSDGVARELLTAQIAQVESDRKAEYDAYYKAQWDRLVEEVPNAKEIFANEHWKTWKNKQSRAMQELAGSDDAEDVIFAINKYAEDMLKLHPELATKKDEQPPAAPADPAAAEKAKQVEAARKQRKTTSVVTETPAAAAQVSTPSDAESLFKKFSDEIRKGRLGN
jgi:myosin heavy subunit